MSAEISSGLTAAEYAARMAQVISQLSQAATAELRSAAESKALTMQLANPLAHEIYSRETEAEQLIGDRYENNVPKVRVLKIN